MTLRMDQVLRQLPELMRDQDMQLTRLEAICAAGYGAMASWQEDPEAADARIEAAMLESGSTFALRLNESPDASFSTSAEPASLVIATDGSSIEPDRFLPVPCFVLNLGWVMLPYNGIEVDCMLASEASLGPLLEAEIGTHRPGPRPSPLTGIALRRDVGELRKAAELAAGVATDRPVAVLLDGTLLPWELDSRQIPEALRAQLLPVVHESLRSLRESPLALAFGAYISHSGASDVVNSLRAIDPHFQHDWQITDGVMFRGLLDLHQRSAIFRAQSHNPNRVDLMLPQEDERCFFYFNAGGDIARVEIPRWMADNPATIEVLHATLIDQCQRCDAYPRALQEAHEQAVISGPDREQFRRYLDAAAVEANRQIRVAGKAMSKRRRAL